MKTLKDLVRPATGIWNDCKNIQVFSGTGLVTSHDLRQAAIEWIKQMRKESNYGTIDGVDISCDEYSCQVTEDWIKHFFNIQESDLV